MKSLISRIVEKGMMSVKLTRGNLNDLVHSCASELREYAIKKEIVFSIITTVHRFRITFCLIIKWSKKLY